MRDADDPSQEHRPEDQSRDIALQVVSLLGGTLPQPGQTEADREARRDAVDALAEVLRQAADFFQAGGWIPTSERLPDVFDSDKEATMNVYTWDGEEVRADRFAWDNYPSAAPMMRKPWFVNDPLLQVRYWRPRDYQTPRDT